MSLEEIAALPVAAIAEPGAHLWLWTTNGFLRQSFDIMDAWGFTYLQTITWIKPSGFGAWFANTTQHLLFGYYQRCTFEGRRFAPTHFGANAGPHTRKPYWLIEEISPEPRIELFARRHRFGWDVWGNEVESECSSSGWQSSPSSS